MVATGDHVKWKTQQIQKYAYHQITFHMWSLECKGIMKTKVAIWEKDRKGPALGRGSARTLGRGHERVYGEVQRSGGILLMIPKFLTSWNSAKKPF